MHSSPEALNFRTQRWLKPAGFAGLGLAAVVAVGGLVDRGMAGQKLKDHTVAEAIPTVDVISPASGGQAERLTLPGDVQAYDNAVIHARVSGYLKRWYVDIGAHVKAGQLLADIDTPELDQQLAQAKANLATVTANQKLAQITAQRWQNLLASDGVSRQEADEKAGDLEAKTAVAQAAKAELDRLQALESFKRIVAPFDGIVTARNTDIGALIAAGNPSDPGLFTVADMRRLRIYVHVPQTYSADMQPGAVATISVPQYPGRTFTAKLVSTSELVSTQSGALLAELQMDNPDGLLKPGDYAQAQFLSTSSSGVMRVPASALMFLQSGMSVAVVGPNGRVQMKPVAIKRDLGAAVEIGSGLGVHDAVIDNPPDSLVDGEQVRVAASASKQRG